MPNKTLVIIVGPTAIGKTALSIDLAKQLNTCIVSVDSRQFFRELNIGTAKPSEKELSTTKHYFINNKSIHDEYNVGIYETEVITLIDELFKKQNTVVAVGGSGLYINAICNGFDELPKANPETRDYLKMLYKSKGITAIQELLKKHDTEYYKEVDINNPHRMMRAIEVSMVAGAPYSSLRKNKTATRSFNIIKIGLNIEREKLYNKINHRVDEMINMGLVEEVKNLHPFKHLNPLQTVGYKELFDYFDHNISLPEAIEKIKQNTRNFAKRQLTWFRKDQSIQWFTIEEKENIMKYITDKID